MNVKSRKRKLKEKNRNLPFILDMMSIVLGIAVIFMALAAFWEEEYDFLYVVIFLMGGFMFLFNGWKLRLEKKQPLKWRKFLIFASWGVTAVLWIFAIIAFVQ
jgi:hypothetical protein